MNSRFDDLDNLQLLRIRLRVYDMDAGGARSCYHEIAPLKVRVGRIRAKGSTACVPAKVMQFISDIRQIDPTDDFAVGLGARIGVDNQHRIGA